MVGNTPIVSAAKLGIPLTDRERTFLQASEHTTGILDALLQPIREQLATILERLPSIAAVPTPVAHLVEVLDKLDTSGDKPTVVSKVKEKSNG